MPLEQVLEKLLPALNEAGILVVQAPATNIHGTECGPSLLTRLIDTETGDVQQFAVPLVLDKQTPQAVGSAITYMRRYSLMSILGLVGEPDTDGEAAMDRPSKAPTRRSNVTRASSSTSPTF